MKKKAMKQANRWGKDAVAAYIAVTTLIDQTWPRRRRNEGVDVQMQEAWTRLCDLTDDEWVAARQILQKAIWDRRFAPYLYTAEDIKDDFDKRIAKLTYDKPNSP